MDPSQVRGYKGLKTCRELESLTCRLSDLPKMNEAYIFVFIQYVVTFGIWAVDVLAVVVQMDDSDGTESACINKVL